MHIEVSGDGLIILLGLIVGATVWVVSAIYGVRNSFEKFAASLLKDVRELYRRVENLEDAE